MSYVKYREDDQKLIDEREALCHGSPIIQRVAPTYYECKYCGAIFQSRDELFYHIKSVHNIVRPLLVVNGKIIGRHVVLQHVREAKISLYGFEEEIFIAGERLLFDRAQGEIIITGKLKSIFNLQRHCELKFENESIIIEYCPIKFNNNVIIDNAIDAWQEATSTGKSLSTNVFSKVTDGEKQYLRGIYNYYIACNAKNEKSKRYDDALSLLSDYNDLSGIGLCVLQVIAFRRNWVNKLRFLTCGGHTVFTTVCEYFSRQSSTFDYEEEGFQGNLYLEDNIKESIELMVLFQKSQLDTVKSRLQTIGNIDAINDINYAAQLNLLSARVSFLEGNMKKALEYYERASAPAFVEEYNSFKQGKLSFYLS